MDAAPPDHLDAISELEDVLADVARIEATAAAAVDACAGLPRADTPEERRAMSRLYGLISATAQAAEALHADGDERVNRIIERRRGRERVAAEGGGADFDALARLGRRRSSAKLRPHAALVSDARAAVDRVKAELDEWLAAVENPLTAGAASTAHRMELEQKDAESDVSVDLLEEAATFVYRVLDGAADRSHAGGLIPECPGLEGPDDPCGAPVAMGHVLCSACNADKTYQSRSRR